MGIEKSMWTKYHDPTGEVLPKGIEIEICTSEKSEYHPFQMDYKDFYFFGQDNKENNLKCPEGLRQTRLCVEEKVYSVWQKKKWEPVDILRILAWKTGKINQKRSSDTGLKYDKDENWHEENLSIQLPYQRTMGRDVFQGFSERVISLHEKYNEGWDVIRVWKELVKYGSEIRGLGTVYLITLLHFITNGDYPIYDRFAMAAMIAKMVAERKKIDVPEGSIIHGCSILPDKSNIKKIEELIESENVYKSYCKLLKDSFNNISNQYRDIDHALWVYGHFFEVS